LSRGEIDSYNTSENRGQSQSYGMNYQKLGKDLLSQDEIAVMDGGKCIMMLRGVRPFLSAKYDITKHPRYKYLSDADKENTFDIEKHLARLRKPRPPVAPDEPFDFYELEDTPDADAIGEIEAEPA
jgi:type IV secretion system protein VirD4